MLRKIVYTACAISMTVGGVSLFSETSYALEKLIKGAPAHVSPLPSAKTPRKWAGALTVYDVQVDQTGDNAVVAREKAMNEAKREAFRKLAKRNNAADVPLPDDRTLGMLVQDFEIQEEKLSATRYVAMFTVRFRDLVRNHMYVDMTQEYPSAFATPEITEFKTDAEKKAEAEKVAKALEEETTTDDVTDTTTDTAQDEKPDALEQSVAESQLKKPLDKGFFDKRTLILPYLERGDKNTILWEADNGWREMWQREGHDTKAGNYVFVVPLGDVTDVSMGSEHAVWSGDYRTVEQLQMKYNADTVLLAIAKKDQERFDVDLYFFDNGMLQKRHTVQSYTGHQSNDIVYRQGVETVRQYIENLRVENHAANRVDIPPNTVEQISKSLTGTTGGTSLPGQVDMGMAPPTGIQSVTGIQTNGAVTTDMTQLAKPYPSTLEAQARTNIDAQMSFSQYATWMDFQRRMSSMMPLVKIQIQSLSKNGARFKIQSNAHVDVVRDELKRNGVLLTQPSVDIQNSMIRNTDAGSTNVYDIRLLN